MPNEIPQRGEPIVFLDIEALPAEADDKIWQGLQRWQTLSEEELEKFRVDKSALHPALARVWMIGFADRNDSPTILSGDGSLEAEGQVLRMFWDHIKDLPNPWWVGHNVKGYDIPVLQVRALRHGLPGLAGALGRTSLKPWERRVIDTLEVWPSGSADRRSEVKALRKLDTICNILGIEQQKGVMGNTIYEAWKSGDQKGAEEHLHYDIVQVREVFRKIFAIV